MDLQGGLNFIMEISFSIFTPVYNRGHCIRDVYNSLINQTYSNFEWIIVNDGSTDNSDEVINDIIRNGKILIKYIKQPNRGKHIAQNAALGIAEGVLFLPLDSDDTIVNNALQILWNEWNNIPAEKRGNYSGIGVHCMDSNGRLIGDKWPAPVFDSNDLEITFKYKVSGEKWGPIRTDIMRKYLNADVRGHFLSESTVWFRIANNYRKRYIDEKLRVYVIHQDSISSRSSSMLGDENAESKLCANLIYINEFWVWFKKYKKKEALMICLSLVKAAVNCKCNLVFGETAIIRRVDPFFVKLIIILSTPLKLYSFMFSNKLTYKIKDHDTYNDL